MQFNGDMNNVRPIVDPNVLNVNVDPEEETKEVLTGEEEETEAEVIPEDFESFNLDAVDKLKESKDEK